MPDDQIFVPDLLDIANVLVIVLDRQGRIVRFNRTCQKLTGYSFDQVKNKPFWDLLLLPEEREGVEAVFNNLLAGQFPNKHENYWLTKDGDHCLIAWSNTATLDENGAVQYVIGTGLDITGRKQVEEELRRERDLLNRIMETSPAGITVVDRRGQLIFANDQAEKILRLSKDEITARTYNAPDWRITDFNGQPIPDEALPFQKVMATGQPVSRMRHAIELPNGSRVLLSVNGAPLLDRSGQIEKVVFTIEDITDHVQIEQAQSWQVKVNAVLAELSRKLLSTISIEEISSLVLEHAQALTNSKFGYVGYIDRQTGSLVCPTMTRDIWDSCNVPDKDFVFEEFGGLWGWVLENRRSLLTNAPAEDPRSSKIPPGHLPIERFLSAPALIGETLVGQVALANSDRDYDEEDLALVERLASLYALAIQRKQAEEALRESEEKFRTLLEGAPAAIVIADETGQIELVNAATEKMFGYEGQELIGHPVEILLPEEVREIHRGKHRPNYLAAPATRLMGIGLDLAGRQKDGSHFPVEVALSYIKTSSGDLIVSYITDISERKRIEQARQRELQSLEQLSGSPAASVTAEAFGLVPLRRSTPDLFQELVQQYGHLLDLALEKQAYKIEHDISTELRTISETIGLLRGGPRDVVEIHTTALKMKASGVYSPKAQAYADEGRLLVLELMGYLTSYYRNHLTGRQPKRSDGHNQAGDNHE